jgi:hypothetical protein
MDDREQAPPGERTDDMARNAGVGVPDMTQPGTGDRPIDAGHANPEQGGPASSPLSRFGRPREAAPSRGSDDAKDVRS